MIYFSERRGILARGASLRRLALGAALFLFPASSFAFYYNLGAFWRSGACGSGVKLVQSAGPTLVAGTSGSVSLSSNETAGDLLVAVVSIHSWTGSSFDYTVSSVVTDSAGNNWYPGPVWNNSLNAGSYWAGGAPAIQLWYSPGIAAGANTVTATLLPTDTNPSDTQFALTVLEYSGLATTDVVDVARAQEGFSVGTTTHVSSGNMTTSTSCDLVVAAVGTVDGYTFTLSSPWHSEATYNSTFPWTYIFDNLPSGTGSGSVVNAGGTLSTADNAWVAGEMAFRTAATTAPAQPTQLAFSTSTQSDSTWTCSGATTVQAQNASGTPTNTSTGLTVGLAGTGMSYFSDPDCEYPITNYATPTQVEAVGSTFTSEVATANFGTPTTAGELITITVFTAEDDCFPTTVTDSGGGTYTAAFANTLGVHNVTAIYYRANAPAGITSVSVTECPTSADGWIAGGHYKGMATSNVLDTYAEAPSGGTTAADWSSTAITTTAPNDLVIAGEYSAHNSGSNCVVEATGSWTSDVVVNGNGNLDGANGGSAVFSHQIVPPLSSVVDTGVVTSCTPTSYPFLAAFKAATTGGSPSVLIGAGSNSATYYFESAAPADNSITASGSSDTSGLLAWWKLDDGSGSSATDASGNSHTMTLTNSPTWTTGEIGGALSFNGTNNTASAGNVAALGGLSAITVTGWIKTTSNVETHLADKSGCGGGVSGGSWELGEDASGLDPGIAYFAIYPAGHGAALAYNASGTVINDGKWHFVAGTWDGLNIDVYVDGVLQDAETTTTNTMYAGTQAVDIGGYCNGGTYYAPETLDDIRVYGRTLPAAELATVMSDRELATVSQTETVSVAPYTWIGSGGGCTAPYNWTNAACWSTGSVPGSGTTAIFDGNCVNCSPYINSSITVGGIWMHSGYTGTISPAANGNTTLTLNDGFEEDGGTFTGSTGSYATTFVDNGSFTLTGGTFTAPGASGSWSQVGDLTVTGGALAANGGTLTLAPSNNAPPTISTETAAFNNVVYNGSGSSGPTVSGTMYIGGNLTINGQQSTDCNTSGGDCFWNGTLAVSGNVYANAGSALGDATLSLVGSGNQTVTSVTEGGLPTGMVIANTGASSTVTFSGNFDPFLTWTYVSGNVSMGATTIPIGCGQGNVNDTISSGLMVFNNVLFEEPGSSAVVVNGTMNIGGNLTISDHNNSSLAGGTIDLTGNLSISSGNGGSANINFVGGSSQTITRTGGTLPGGTFTVNSGGGTIAEVQATPQSVGYASDSVSFSSLPQPGDAILVYVIGTPSTGNTWPSNGVTDNQGNTYSLAVANNGNSNFAAPSAIYYTTGIGVPSGTFTITATPTAPVNINMIAVEYAGMAKTGALDQTATNSGSGATAVSGTTSTTAQNNELAAVVLSWGCNTGTCTVTTPTGYTSRLTDGSHSDPNIQASDMILSATGAQSASWTQSGAGLSSPPYSNAAIATFKAAPAGTLTFASNIPLSSGQLLNVFDGTLNLNGYNLTGSPAVTAYAMGTIEAQGGETVTATKTFNSGSSMLYNGGGNYTSMIFGNSYSNLELDGWGGWGMSTTATVSGNLTLARGTYNNGGTTTISGNLINSGGELGGAAGTITFSSGASHTISGSTTFNNLTMDDSGNASADTLTFASGATQTVSNTLTLKGNSTNNLKLRSSNTGTQWLVNPTTAVAQDVDVEDSDNTNATAISANGKSVNSTNNTNWDFTALALVQQATASWTSGSSYGVTLSGAPASGDVLVLGQGASGTSANNKISSITETGVTWTKAVQSNSNEDAEIWYGVVGASASASITVTLTGTPTTTSYANVSEWSGLNTSSPLVASGTSANHGGSGATASTSTVTPTAGQNVLLFAVTYQGGTLSSGPTNGFTALSTPSSGVQFGYEFVPNTSTSYSTSWTFSASHKWETEIGTFTH